MRKRPHIKTAATNDDRGFLARMDVSNCFDRRGAELFDIHLLIQGYRAEQVMRHLFQDCLLRFRREPIEPAINLERIRADNFRI